MGVVRADEVEVKRMFPGVTHRFAVTESLGATDCQMGQVVLEPGAALAPHKHPVSDAMYILSGRGILTLGQEEIPIEAGMFVVAPPNTRHGLLNNGNQPLAIIFTWPTGREVPRIPAP